MPSSEEFYLLRRDRKPFWRLKYASMPQKLLFGVLVLVTAITGWRSLFYYEWALRSATASPTMSNPSGIMDHGRYLYFTPEQAHTIHFLDVASFLLTVATLVTAFWLLGAFHDAGLLIRKVRDGTLRI